MSGGLKFSFLNMNVDILALVDLAQNRKQALLDSAQSELVLVHLLIQGPLLLATTMKAGNLDQSCQEWPSSVSCMNPSRSDM